MLRYIDWNAKLKKTDQMFIEVNYPTLYIQYSVDK